MRKLLTILFIGLITAHAQKPAVIAEAYSVLTNQTSDTLIATTCDPCKLPITSYAWTKIAGLGAPVVNGSGSTIGLTGLQSGKYIYQVSVKNSAGQIGTDTVAFTVALPPTVVHDTLYITKTIHDTIPRLCPPIIIPAQRTAVGVSFSSGKITVIYDNGTNSNL